MQFRSLLLLGFCASLALSVPAIAGMPPATASPAPASSALDTVTVAAPKAETDAAKKKKLAAEAKAKAKEKAKLAAKAKADKTKQLAAKAQADKTKQLAAKAQADKEKLAAAKAKADKTKQLAAKAQADKAKAEKLKLAAAKAKADEKKKLEAKAKAAEQQKLAAKAKAERDKQLAAEAKAQAAAKLAKAKADEERRVAKAKADKERQIAKAKADEERRIARAQADEQRRIARAQAEQERQVAKAKAAEERRLLAEAKIRAAEEKRMAKIRAEEQRRLAIAQAAEAARQAEIARLVSMEVVQTGNNGELRSEKQEAPKKPVGLFASLFGAPAPKQSMLAETRALDAALELKEANKKFVVRPEFEPQVVTFAGYPKGTIVIDTASHYLYLMESSSRARRYAIAVGKEGLQFKGEVHVGDKQEWPRWIPTKEMQQRDPKKYGQYAEGMPGGGQNPLGARAIYLYQSGKDTHLRIHGTIAPETIGTDSSNGCFRMINEHVMDLYRRVPVGTDVVIL